MKKPSWLRWSREDKPADTPARDIETVRRKTDQKIREQNVQKQQRDDEAEDRGSAGKKNLP